MTDGHMPVGRIINVDGGGMKHVLGVSRMVNGMSISHVQRMFGEVGSIHDGNGVIGGKIDLQNGAIDQKANACQNGPMCDGHAPIGRNMQLDGRGQVRVLNVARIPYGIGASHV